MKYLMALVLCFSVSSSYAQLFKMNEIEGDYRLSLSISGHCPSVIKIFDKTREEISVQKCGRTAENCRSVNTMTLGFEELNNRLKSSTHIYPSRIGNNKRSLVFNHFLLETPLLRESRVLNGSEYTLAKSEDGDGYKMVYKQFGADKSVMAMCIYNRVF